MPNPTLNERIAEKLGLYKHRLTSTGKMCWVTPERDFYCWDNECGDDGFPDFLADHALLWRMVEELGQGGRSTTFGSFTSGSSFCHSLGIGLTIAPTLAEAVAEAWLAWRHESKVS